MPIEDILKAGFSQTEEENLDFLLGLGVKTGSDLRYIDGFTTAEATFRLVGNVFMLKKICTKMQTAADQDRLDKNNESVVTSLKDVASYLQKIDKLEKNFNDRIVANRKIQAGESNVIQLRPVFDKSMKSRDSRDCVRSLEDYRKKGFESREDVMEFLVGLGIQPIEGIRYVSGHTVKETMRSMVGSLVQMKKECVTALRKIELVPSHLCPNEICETHNHIHSFLHSLKVEESAFFARMSLAQKPRYGGNVVPLNRG